MTKAFLLKNLKNSIGTYTYLHWITGFFLFVSSLVIYTSLTCLITLIIIGIINWNSLGNGSNWSMAWPFYSTLLLLGPIGFIFEPIYINHIRALSNSLKIKPDNENLFFSSIKFYFPHKKYIYFPLVKGMMFLPISLFKTSIKILLIALKTSLLRKDKMVEVLHHLRGWRNGIPLEKFIDLHPDKKYKPILYGLRRWNLISISVDSPNEIFVNHSIITTWASGRIFIFPLRPEVEIFTSIFVTLNNYAKSKYWKIKTELLVTILVRLCFCLIPCSIIGILLFYILPTFSIKAICMTSLTLLVGLVFVVKAPNLFTKNTI